MTVAKDIRTGLIGANIEQSKSPMLHMTEARALGFELAYELIDLEACGLTPDALPQLLDQAEAEGFAGVNITHPCKQRVIPLLHTLSEDAQGLGAVNTVVFADGRRTGHNTDWSGYLESFRRGLPGAGLSTVLQIGAGGAGAAVAHANLKLGVSRLFLTDRDMRQAEALSVALNQRAGRDFAEPTTNIALAARQADGLVNTTPMGMDAHPGLPIDADLVESRHWVSDIVYFPIETAFLAHARAKGCRVLDGGGMAVFQAAGAFLLFTGRMPDAERMLDCFRRS